MLDFIKGKFSRSYLGVDIGTISIKAVEVKKGERGPALVNYAMLESEGSLVRANAASSGGSLRLFEEETVEFLKLLLQKMNTQTTAAMASLPSFSSFTTILNFPEMSMSDLEKSISFQAKQYIPIPVSEAALDWTKVGEYKDDSGFKYFQILLISVPQEQIRRYQNIFKQAGLNLVALEIESVSLARALTGGDQTLSFILDIGSRASSVLIAQNGELKFAGQTDFGSASITQGIASSLNINPLRAEELKRERGLLESGPASELSTIMLPFLDAIINEVRRVEFNFRSQFPNAPKIERIILTGGGANLLGLPKYVSNQLNIPAVKASPLARFEYPKEIEPLVPELNTKLSAAIGLPLREFSK